MKMSKFSKELLPLMSNRWRCVKCGSRIPVIPNFTKYHEVFRYKTKEGKIKRVPTCLACQMLEK